MLKHLLSLGLLVLLPVVYAAQTGQYNYMLYKLYPKTEDQVEFIKQVARGESSEYKYNGQPPAILTPLSKGKTVYAFVPKSANEKFQNQASRQHLKSVLVEFTTVQQLSVDNQIHTRNTFPQSPRANYLIESPRVTNWGLWGVWGECQPGEFVVGMKLKTEAKQGLGDDTALNAIRLLCAAPGSHDFKEIQSLEGPWGQFGRTFYCPEGARVHGFELRSERSQGAGDDTAANNLRILCADANNQQYTVKVIEGDGTKFGDWSGAQKCLNGQAVCGLRTQVEPELGIGDDTAMNNVDMVCCDINPVPDIPSRDVPPGLIESILATALEYGTVFTPEALARLHGGYFGTSRSVRDFDVTIYNTLEKTFRLVKSSCDTGSWSQRLLPDVQIPAHSSVAMGAQIWGTFIGLHDCQVEYESTDGTSSFWISVTNPWTGDNRAEIRSSPDIQIKEFIFNGTPNYYAEGRFIIQRKI